jgi:hypothetical protein
MTQVRQRCRISAAVGTSPAPSSGCCVTVPWLVVYVPLLVCVDSLVVRGASMRSQALRARRVDRVLASEICVTVTIPPKATRVATTAMIRRRPLNHFECWDSRRYFALRMGDTFL